MMGGPVQVQVQSKSGPGCWGSESDPGPAPFRNFRADPRVSWSLPEYSRVRDTHSNARCPPKGPSKWTLTWEWLTTVVRNSVVWYVRGRIQRCDWRKITHSLEIHTEHIQKTRFLTNHSAALYVLLPTSTVMNGVISDHTAHI